jgi:4-hydroxy-tetrahydrodipicolinate reductase
VAPFEQSGLERGGIQMTRIIMNGCYGRMGRMITQICDADETVQIVAGVDAFGAACDTAYPVYKSLAEVKEEADAIIDFSNASGTDKLLDYCVAKQIPCALCTTGLSEEQLAHVKEASTKVAILRSANMSLGVNLLIKLLKEAAPILAEAGFDVEIVEKHHNQKLDAPSGTAIALADAVNEGAGNIYEYVYDRSQVRKKREKKELGISAVRGGTIVGDHDVLFAGEDEVITFSHRAYSRALFGKGAVAAAKFLAGKGPGMYSMADVIG